MKIPLVGQDFTSRSIATSAQTCVNLYPETIKDPSEHAKNLAALYGTPGRHLFTTPGGTIHGVWSGGGRLFVINGNSYTEISQAGSTISTHALPGPIVLGPAVMAANGNQLMIVAGGRAYCDSGAGPVACTFDPYAGVVDVDGTKVTWISGDKFNSDGSWIGRAIVINGVTYTIAGAAGVKDPRHPTHGNTAPAAPSPTLLYLTGSAGTQSGVDYSALGAPVTAVGLAYLDGTFFVQRPRGGTPDLGRQVNFSGVFNGISWNGNDFFTKEAWPDYIRSILVDAEQLYLFGDETFEVHQADPNATGDQNPFPPIPGAMGRFGSVSAYCQVAIDGNVFFLAGDDRGNVGAYVLDGFTPKKVSNSAEEAIWNAQGLGRGAISYVYSEEGHSFWVINFDPLGGLGSSQTWAYDTIVGAWHRRARWDGSAFQAYQTNLHTFIPEWGANGKHITSCTPAGVTGGSANLYESSVNFYDDDGSDITWERALPYLYNEGKWQYFGRLDLEMETGTVASGPEPTITLDYSDDRGKTFINPRTAGIGVAGATSRRVFWLRGGKSRGRVPRFRGTGQSKVALINMEWDIELGST